jgi:hypothetical protein
MAHIKGHPVIKGFSKKSFWDKMVSSQLNNLWQSVEGRSVGLWSVLPDYGLSR